jgi:hypothetical protein
LITLWETCEHPANKLSASFRGLPTRGPVVLYSPGQAVGLMGELMKRLIMIALACVSLGACATTGTPGTSLVGSGFDFSPTPSPSAPQRASQFGYRLTGSDGWQGDMLFEMVQGEARVALSLDVDAAPTRADLRIAMPYLDGGVRRYSGVAADGRAVEVELQAGPCETREGRTQAYFATVALAGHAMTGCAAEVSTVDRWSNYLPDYLPAIDACLAELGEEADHVSLAHTLPGGATGIRLVDRQGTSWECAMGEGGRRINSLRTITGADAVAGEGDPIFVRNVMPDAAASCYVYESVRDADGHLIGALGYDACDGGSAPGVG